MSAILQPSEGSEESVEQDLEPPGIIFGEGHALGLLLVVLHQAQYIPIHSEMNRKSPQLILSVIPLALQMIVL